MTPTLSKRKTKTTKKSQKLRRRSAIVRVPNRKTVADRVLVREIDINGDHDLEIDGGHDHAIEGIVPDPGIDRETDGIDRGTDPETENIVIEIVLVIAIVLLARAPEIDGAIADDRAIDLRAPARPPSKSEEAK